MKTTNTPHILTIEQVTQLFKAAQGHPLEAFIALAMTGMRYGEMLALQWSDINVEKRCLQVRHSVAFVGSLPVIGAPKTKESWNWPRKMDSSNLEINPSLIDWLAQKQSD